MIKNGFTLIELMIVVAMISVLATLAVPAYHHYIEESARSEAHTILADIAAREVAYQGAWGAYIATGGMPTLDPEKIGQREPQKDAGLGWTRLGYTNDPRAGLFGGPVYFRYNVTVGNNAYSACGCRLLNDGTQECGSLRKANARAVAFTGNCLPPL